MNEKLEQCFSPGLGPACPTPSVWLELVMEAVNDGGVCSTCQGYGRRVKSLSLIDLKRMISQDHLNFKKENANKILRALL